jgi:hypothetical protein
MNAQEPSRPERERLSWKRTGDPGPDDEVADGQVQVVVNGEDLSC